jgi:hypothetical protein
MHDSRFFDNALPHLEIRGRLKYFRSSLFIDLSELRSIQILLRYFLPLYSHSICMALISAGIMRDERGALSDHIMPCSSAFLFLNFFLFRTFFWILRFDLLYYFILLRTSFRQAMSRDCLRVRNRSSSALPSESSRARVQLQVEGPGEFKSSFTYLHLRSQSTSTQNRISLVFTLVDPPPSFCRPSMLRPSPCRHPGPARNAEGVDDVSIPPSVLSIYSTA